MAGVPVKKSRQQERRIDRHNHGEVVWAKDGKGLIVYQPEVMRKWGPFEILLRTDGKYAVCDWRKPVSEVTVKLAMRMDVAARMAKELWEQDGRPEFEP